jgi:hypothetical protein
VVEYGEETRSHQAPTYDHSGAVGTHSLRSVHAWTKSERPPGQALCEPAPPFRKLDEGVIEEEYARLEGKFERGKLLLRSRDLDPGSC